MNGQVNWRKSSYSGYNGNCVEVAAGWEKSSYCEGGACVEVGWRKSSRSQPNGNCAEVAQNGGRVLVRDSKNPGGGVLSFSPADWAAFLDGVKAAVPDLGVASLAEMPDPATLDTMVQRVLPGATVPPRAASGAAFSSAI